MAKGKKKLGRKKKEDSQQLKELAAEFLIYYELNKTKSGHDLAQLWAAKEGYKEFTKKEFCDIWGVGKDFFAYCQRYNNEEFWGIYHDIVINAEKVSLPMVLKHMARKNPESWYKTVFRLQAQEVFKQKYEGSITIEDGKAILGNAFEVISS